VKAESDRFAGEAKQAGHGEPSKAIAADALVRLACRDTCFEPAASGLSGGGGREDNKGAVGGKAAHRAPADE
jgi:hypothetical protein